MPKDTIGPTDSEKHTHVLSVDEIELLYCFRLMSEEGRAATLGWIASMIRRPRREPDKPKLSIV